MNCTQFKNPLCYLCLFDCMVTLWSATQGVASSNNPFLQLLFSLNSGKNIFGWTTRLLLSLDITIQGSPLPAPRHVQTYSTWISPYFQTCSTWTSPYKTPPPMCSNLFNLDLTIQGPPPPPICG